LFAGVGCPDRNHPDGDNSKPLNISKDELIGELNKNSAAVRELVISGGSVVLKNAEYPNGFEAEATLAFKKPTTIYLGATKLGATNILVVKSDGKYFEYCDFEHFKGLVGRLEHLNSATEKGLFSFRPDLLSMAMALQEIDPARAVLDTKEPKLVISEADGTRRELYVSADEHLPVKQVIYGKDGGVLLSVIYEKMLRTTLPDNTSVFIPSEMTITGREEGASIKIRSMNSKTVYINNDRAFNNALGDYGKHIKFPADVQVSELQADGSWKPIDLPAVAIPPDKNPVRIWRPEQNG
jgi:hypothetical protein